MRRYIGLITCLLLTCSLSPAADRAGTTASNPAASSARGRVTPAKAGRPNGSRATVAPTPHKRSASQGRRPATPVPGQSRGSDTKTFAIDRCDSGWAALLASRGSAVLVSLPINALPERCSEGALVSLRVIATWSSKRLPGTGRRSRLEVVRWTAEDVFCRNGARVLKLPRALVPGPLRRGHKLSLVVQSKVAAPPLVAQRQEPDQEEVTDIDLCVTAAGTEVRSSDTSSFNGEGPTAAVALERVIR